VLVWLRAEVAGCLGYGSRWRKVSAVAGCVDHRIPAGVDVLGMSGVDGDAGVGWNWDAGNHETVVIQDRR
jgi:hypothetical protein